MRQVKEEIQALQEEIRRLREVNKSLVSKLPKQQKKIYPLSIRYVIEIHKDIEETSLANAKNITVPYFYVIYLES